MSFNLPGGVPFGARRPRYTQADLERIFFGDLDDRSDLDVTYSSTASTLGLTQQLLFRDLVITSTGALYPNGAIIRARSITIAAGGVITATGESAVGAVGGRNVDPAVHVGPLPYFLPPSGRYGGAGGAGTVAEADPLRVGQSTPAGYFPGGNGMHPDGASTTSYRASAGQARAGSALWQPGRRIGTSAQLNTLTIEHLMLGKWTGGAGGGGSAQATDGGALAGGGAGGGVLVILAKSVNISTIAGVPAFAARGGAGAVISGGLRAGGGGGGVIVLVCGEINTRRVDAFEVRAGTGGSPYRDNTPGQSVAGVDGAVYFATLDTLAAQL